MLLDLIVVARSNSRRREGGDGWEASGDEGRRLCLTDDSDDEDCATTSQTVTSGTSSVSVDHRTTSDDATWLHSQTSRSSTSSVTTSTTASTTTTSATTITTTPHPPSLPASQVVYRVIPSTSRSPSLASTAAAIDAAGADMQSISPVPMNIGLIVGVAVAIAVLLCMLAYVVYKCVVAGQGPGVAAVGGAYAEKTALGVDRAHHHHHHHHQAPPQFAVNGRPPPLLVSNDASKKDVKEWFVWNNLAWPSPPADEFRRSLMMTCLNFIGSTSARTLACEHRSERLRNIGAGCTEQWRNQDLDVVGHLRVRYGERCSVPITKGIWRAPFQKFSCFSVYMKLCLVHFGIILSNRVESYIERDGMCPNAPPWLRQWQLQGQRKNTGYSSPLLHL